MGIFKDALGVRKQGVGWGFKGASVELLTSFTWGVSKKLQINKVIKCVSVCYKINSVSPNFKVR